MDFFYTDRQHLEIAVDKVRTGSSRQSRVGDVDGYYGLDLALTVEVKDFALTASNYERQLTAFLDKVRTNPSTVALVVAAEAEEVTRQALQTAGVAMLTISDLARIVVTWDWHKQDRAVHAVLHYLAHVEQNPVAVARLLDFVRQHHPAHASLSGYAATPDAAATDLAE